MRKSHYEKHSEGYHGFCDHLTNHPRLDAKTRFEILSILHEDLIVPALRRNCIITNPATLIAMNKLEG